MEAIDFFIGKFTKIIETCAEYLNKMYNVKVTKESDVIKLLKMSREYNNKLDDLYKSIKLDNNTNFTTGSGAYYSLFKVCKSFNLKYSDESVEEKKKIKEKLEKYQKNLLSTTKDLFEIEVFTYGTTTNKITKSTGKTYMGDKVYETKKKLEEIKDKYNIGADLFNSWYSIADTLQKELNYTFNDIAYSIAYLRLDRSETLIYKIVNKVFKTPEKSE
jgi:hypothetical protein